jgi:hypothetical protein
MAGLPQNRNRQAQAAIPIVRFTGKNNLFIGKKPLMKVQVFIPEGFAIS